jgi:hypothetical protein
MTRARLPVSVVVNALPVMPWMWTLAFWHNENRTPTPATLNARGRKAAFAKSGGVSEM